MFDVEHSQKGERAALIQVDIGRAFDAAVEEEFHLLAVSAGAQIVWTKSIVRGEAEARYLIGKGQVEEIARAVCEHQIELVIFNAQLTPSQERNLEKILQARVLDRNGLVLDIFAQRARSHEGKLQVELAQLNHLSTRLVRGWTHLERQKGGIGLRGPGETQLETDRRLLAIRIRQLEKKLEKVARQRDETRKNRARKDRPTVALAGYTNSGKSTLFNLLTDANVLTQDLLFATLDPTWRKLNHASNMMILLADTVGFVSDLPHELVAAFQSTLEETIYADLILQVIDISDKEYIARTEIVDDVLAEIGAEAVPRIRVYNKIDLVGKEPQVVVDEHGLARTVFVSALTGAGRDLIADAIVQFFQQYQKEGWITLQPHEGALRAELFNEKAVLEERIAADGAMNLRIVIDEKRLQQLQSRYNRRFELKSY